MEWRDVQIALDELSRHYQDVMAAAGNDADARKWARDRMAGYDRAARAAQGLTDPIQTVNGRYLIPSRTHGDRIYRATSSSCNCEGGTAGAWCWHMAMADAIDHASGVSVDYTPPPEAADPFELIDQAATAMASISKAATDAASAFRAALPDTHKHPELVRGDFTPQELADIDEVSAIGDLSELAALANLDLPPALPSGQVIKRWTDEQVAAKSAELRAWDERQPADGLLQPFPTDGAKAAVDEVAKTSGPPPMPLALETDADFDALLAYYDSFDGESGGGK